MRLPGDLKKNELIDQMIRVNHAGEFGAKQIYQGQMKVLKDPEDQKTLQHMLSQELTHLDYFSKELVERRTRPSIFMPIWQILGFAIGSSTAALGKNSAMICTEAVEEVIDEHYQDQLKQLENLGEQNLSNKISQFREEELEHQKIAQDQMKNLNLGHRMLYNLIKFGCKISINLAKY